MISNLATTIFCCLNEMFRFQRDREGFLKMAPLLPWNTRSPFKNKVFCSVFSERTMALSLILEDRVLSSS